MLKATCVILGAVVVSSLLGASAAQAATITGSTGSAGAMIAYQAYNLNSGTSDWAAFGGLGASGSPTDFTYKQGASSFSAVNVLQGTAYISTINGPIKFGYGAASGTYASPGVSSIDVNPVVGDKGGGSSQLSFTHTMLAANEDLRVFVLTKTYADNAVDVLASISGSTAYSQTLALPDALHNFAPYNPRGDFGKGGFGIVTLNISDATVGDTLTFTLTGNYAGKSPAGWWGVGIAGATATTVVPEPAALGLFGISAALVFGRRRRSA